MIRCNSVYLWKWTEVGCASQWSTSAIWNWFAVVQECIANFDTVNFSLPSLSLSLTVTSYILAMQQLKPRFISKRWTADCLSIKRQYMQCLQPLHFILRINQSRFRCGCLGRWTFQLTIAAWKLNWIAIIEMNNNYWNEYNFPLMKISRSHTVACTQYLVIHLFSDPKWSRF